MKDDFVVAIGDGGLHLVGRLDAERTPMLEDELNVFIDGGVTDLELDLSAVEVIERPAVDVLVAISARLAAQKGSILIRRPSPAATEALTASGLTVFFDFEIAAH